MAKPLDFNLSVKEAAKKLGKSITTIHRYVNKGKLSGEYVNTDHGREVRLREDEVEDLAEKLGNVDELQNEKEVFEENKDSINIRQLLERYERTLYQLGELNERLKQKDRAKKEKIDQLETEKERLEAHLHDQSALVEALEDELTRPLTLRERLKGERITNR